jgi:hypothetical protein
MMISNKRISTLKKFEMIKDLEEIILLIIS